MIECMKPFQILSLFSLSALTLSCGSIDPDASIGFERNFNPLDPAGFTRTRSAKPVELTGDASGTYRVGDYVEVASPKTPMFTAYPRSGAVPKTTLEMGTVLSVLGLDGTYMHVQTESNGEGYVPNVMVQPQGLLVTTGLNSAEELPIIEWSEMEEAQPGTADAPVTPKVEKSKASE